MSRIEVAASCFKDGFSCSQAVFSTYATQLGLNHEAALKIAGAFGGGMGHMGETCGAVTGAFMVIGLRYGRTIAGDRQSQDKTDSLVNEFVNRFKSRNVSIVCKELLGCDLSTPEGTNMAKERNLFATICPEFVQDAAEIIEQILE
ncbi:MAG: C-GCAxxG-C-C family protein [Dehalococcoidales bacterium]